jgi:hypothetical protein
MVVVSRCARSKAGRTSQCAPLSAVIEQALLAGLSAQRIYQDLVTDHQFTGGYDAVKRFVRSLQTATELPFRRMECAPGQELQVDFGQGAWVMEQGKRRRPHLFRAVLAHSRKGYSEVVWRQTSESFLRCLENAFRYPAHLHSRKRHIIERGADHLLDRCRMIGPLTGTWAEGMHQTRGPQSLRVMQGLLQLAEKHPVAELEKAARVATHHGTWRLRDLKRLLALPGNVVQMDFLESHPLIRSLAAYRIELNTNQNTTPST